MEKDKLLEIFEDSRQEFDLTYSAQKEERNLCFDDRRFYSIAGAQWEGNYGEQFANKPQPEINKTHKSIIEIVDEYRNNPVSAGFTPKDGEKNDQLSDMLNGLFRADQEDSNAKEAYDNGFEESCSGGFGGWRLTAQYEDEYDDENEFQRIRIEPIFEADRSVYFDLDSKLQDKSDAKKCWVITSMTHQKYKDLYDDSPSSWPKDTEGCEFDWYTPKTVNVAEYYKVEETKEKIQIWKDLAGKETRYKESELKDDPEIEQKLIALGSEMVRERSVKRKRVHKYIMSGSGILEDLGYIPGSEIPIVPCYGKRWYINNIERFMGHVRLSKDPQRIKNVQTSKLMEIAALSSVEKPYFTPEQVADHMDMHSSDNIENWPYLLINTIKDANGNEVAMGPLGYSKVPQIPPALTGLIQLCDQDMKEISGVSQANEEMVSNISDKAIKSIQNKVDKKTYIYISNFAKAIERTAQIWLPMAKDLYVEDGRKMKTVGKQKEIGNVKLNIPSYNEETGAYELKNDITKSKMGVSVSVGPTSESKRQKTIDNVTSVMPFVSDPETQGVLSSVIISNMEGEGIEDIRKWSRHKLLQLGAVEPTEEELKTLQEQANARKEPSSTEILERSVAMESQAKAKKAEADALKSFAEVEETQVDTEKKRAETLEIMRDLDRKDLESLSRMQQPATIKTNPGKPE